MNEIITINILQKLHPKFISWMMDKGWTELKPIQQIAFSTVYSGVDCILEAPTAGGKTEAVLFPVLSREAANLADSIQVLYLAPLRALLNNVELRISEYSKVCGLHAFKWHGDVDNRKKWEEFRTPSHVLMTTPESMEAIFQGKPGWVKYFKNLSTVIIDEAHNFASGDRGSHLVSILERLESGIERNPQRIALTATIGNPNRLLQWLAGTKRKLGKRIFVDEIVKKQKSFSLDLFEFPQEADRLFNSLREDLLGHRSLVFVRSRNQAEGLAKAFSEDAKARSRPLRIRTHHSAVSKYFREEAEARLKIKGESGVDAVISTSTLELGIDIGEIDRVFQIDANPSPSALLQRVGRTGRRKESSGQFFRGLLCDPDDLILMSGVMSLALKGISEDLDMPTRSFHILAHQLLCMAHQAHGISPEVAWEVLNKCDCFKDILYDEFNRLVIHLLEKRILRNVDGDVLIGEEGEKKFLVAGGRNLFAVFETGPMYEVFEGKNHVGSLDSGFVETSCKEMPFFFVLAGILWKAERVSLEGHSVIASRSKVGDAPIWNTFGGHDVSWRVAQEVGRLLKSGKSPDFLQGKARTHFISKCELWRAIPWEEEKLLFVPVSRTSGRLISFAGDRINRTFAKMLVADGIIQKENISANYEGVDFKAVKTEKSVEMLLFDFWNSLLEMSTLMMANKLITIVPQKPFSRLTACLPPDLLAASYIDKSMDCDGLKDCLKLWGKINVFKFH